MTKKFITSLLIFLIIFYGSIPALAFNRENLLRLKPLLSERFSKIAQANEDRKIWPSLGLGLLGLGLMSLQGVSQTVSEKYFTLSYGYWFLLMGVEYYLAESDYKIDRKVLDEISLPGIEKEMNSYYLLKTYAQKSEARRKYDGLLLIAYGLGWAFMINNSDVTQAQKTSVNIFGALFAGLGLLFYSHPSDIEKEMAQIDSELGK